MVRSATVMKDKERQKKSYRLKKFMRPSLLSAASDLRLVLKEKGYLLKKWGKSTKVCS